MAFELNDVHKSVLKRYSRPIVHMRHQVRKSRFGLVFGAGLSAGFGIPNWKCLVDRLADDPKIDGKKILEADAPNKGLPYRTEMLFEHFKQKKYAKADENQHHTRKLDFSISAEWREIVRNNLYSTAIEELEEKFVIHPYLKTYIPLIHRSHMTVTYNFDDLIEKMLLWARPDAEKGDSLGFESVTNPSGQFRRTKAIIYHPNGVIPKSPLDTPSDRFVFSEASYAEQLMGIFAGNHAGLLTHLSKHTCLLIGLSLEDETLRNVLVQAARSSPGNFHYYIHFLNDGEKLDDDQIATIIKTNFKVYNLITIFLDEKDINALGELINIDELASNALCDFAAKHNIAVQFRFYITGSMGVGKSTAINQFRNLHVLDEWLDPPLPILAKGWENLTPEEREEADGWILEQFEKKNQILRNTREGIFILNRGPLDPFSFGPEAGWSAKAARYLDHIAPQHTDWVVEPGRVILLQGDSEELALRMVLTQRKDYTADKLGNMERQLERAYGPSGVTCVDTRGLTPSDVAQRTAEIIHLESYEDICCLHNRLTEMKESRSDVTS